MHVLTQQGHGIYIYIFVFLDPLWVHSNHAFYLQSMCIAVRFARHNVQDSRFQVSSGLST